MTYIKIFPISISCTSDDLEEIFERYGEIQQTLFSTDFGSQRVALVEFVTRKSADRAVEFDGERISGKIVSA
jgi:RNA recognition motif-containing protein